MPPTLAVENSYAAHQGGGSPVMVLPVPPPPCTMNCDSWRGVGVPPPPTSPQTVEHSSGSHIGWRRPPWSVAQPPPYAPPLPVLGSVPQPLPHAPPQPVLGSVAQPRWRVQNKCPVMHGRSACAVCAQCRRCRGLAHLVCLRQLCSQHATRCLNFAISSNDLAILDSTAAHRQPLLVPLPPSPLLTRGIQLLHWCTDH